MRIHSLVILTLATWGLMSGCGRDTASAPSADPQAPSSAPAPAPTQQPSPPFALRPSLAQPRTPAPGGQGRLIFELPEGWTSETPSSSMRLAQAAIPGEAGDGQLAVFYFGAGQGGGVEDNLERWSGQVDQEPGSEPKRESFESGALRITWIEVRGTLKPSRMGMGPQTPQPGSALIGAVVEGEGGPWFFKATGPADTLLPQRDAFVAMLESVQPGG